MWGALHANVWVGANDRAELERLCRYLLRPPFAQERLRRLSDSRVALATVLGAARGGEAQAAVI